jgi:hypothetical protein
MAYAVDPCTPRGPAVRTGSTVRPRPEVPNENRCSQRRDFLADLGFFIDDEPEGPFWDTAFNGLHLADARRQHPDDALFAALVEALDAVETAATDVHDNGGLANPYVREEMKLARNKTRALLDLITDTLAER